MTLDSHLPTVGFNIKPLKTLSIVYTIVYCCINYMRLCQCHLRDVQVKLVHVGAPSAIHNNIMICIIRLLDLCSGSAYIQYPTLSPRRTCGMLWCSFGASITFQLWQLADLVVYHHGDFQTTDLYTAYTRSQTYYA